MNRNSTPSRLQWLFRRLIPEGEGILHWASYAIIFGVMVMMIMNRELASSTWSYYLSILGLLGMFLVIIATNDLRERSPDLPTDLIALIANGILMLLVAWFDVSGLTLYVIFMLSAQAFTGLAFWPALGYVVTVSVSWLVIFILRGVPLGNLPTAMLGLAMGNVFVMMLALLMRRNNQQREEMERLVNELRAARQREEELVINEERIRLAREIHDGLGHHLTVLNVQLQAAGKLINRAPEQAAAIVETCRSEAQAALEEVRRSVAAMRQTPLDGKTLEEAIAGLVADFDAHSLLSARFEQRGTPAPCGQAAEMTLYRAVQEGLTNAQKHAAGAGRVDVTLIYTGESVECAVRDDGSAPGGEPGKGGRFGLAGLRERAEQLGGALRTSRQKNGGFELVLTIPLKKAGDDQGNAC